MEPWPFRIGSRGPPGHWSRQLRKASEAGRGPGANISSLALPLVPLPLLFLPSPSGHLLLRELRLPRAYFGVSSLRPRRASSGGGPFLFSALAAHFLAISSSRHSFLPLPSLVPRSLPRQSSSPSNAARGAEAREDGGKSARFARGTLLSLSVSSSTPLPSLPPLPPLPLPDILRWCAPWSALFHTRLSPASTSPPILPLTARPRKSASAWPRRRPPTPRRNGPARLPRRGIPRHTTRR